MVVSESNEVEARAPVGKSVKAWRRLTQIYGRKDPISKLVSLWINAASASSSAISSNSYPTATYESVSLSRNSVQVGRTPSSCGELNGVTNWLPFMPREGLDTGRVECDRRSDIYWKKLGTGTHIIGHKGSRREMQWVCKFQNPRVGNQKTRLWCGEGSSCQSLIWILE